MRVFICVYINIDEKNNKNVALGMKKNYKINFPNWEIIFTFAE